MKLWTRLPFLIVGFARLAKYATVEHPVNYGARTSFMNGPTLQLQTSYPANWIVEPASLPATPGSYLLMAELIRPAALPQRFKTAELAPGIYIYAGNARGPGGIRARCARHFRQSKRRHWHIDWLTEHAISLHAAAFPKTNECELIEEICKNNQVEQPIKGFGSSDCTRCQTHLLRVLNNA